MFPRSPLIARCAAIFLASLVAFGLMPLTSAGAVAGAARVVVLGGSGAVADSVLRELESCVPDVDRLSGTDRYATAVEIAKDGFGDSSIVYLATGTDFPDALAAGPAAVASGSPVLLVHRDWIPASTATELKRLEPDQIILLGGVAAISSAVETAVSAGDAGVIRVSGSDRYATAAEISRHAFPGGANIAYVVAGGDFPDALAAGAVAAHRDAPILLTQSTMLPKATLGELNRLSPDAIVIVGGTGAISSAVAKALSAVAPVTRIAGADRYETAAASSASTFSPGVATIYIATGEDYPDALAGTALAGSTGGPVLLTRSDALPGSVRAEIERLIGTTCSGAVTPLPPAPSNEVVGFLGCSNSVRAVRGITQPDVLWSAGQGEHAYGGGDLETWSDLNDPRWNGFQDYLDSEGPPEYLWWQLCPKHVGGPDPSAEEIAQVQTILSEIQRRTPGTHVFVSPINDFEGVTCSRIGTNGVAATEALSDLLAADPDVFLGPVLSALTPTTVEPDGCHQNDAGAAIHGAELVAFFSSS